MLVFNLTPPHYFVNIFTKNLSKKKIEVFFMMSIERAVESTIKTISVPNQEAEKYPKTKWK